MQGSHHTAAARQTHHGSRTRAIACAAGLAAGLSAGLVGTLTTSAIAQPIGGTRIDPASVTADAFGPIRLPLAAVPGNLAFAGQRAWAWQAGDTRRLLLDNDADVVLGSYRFHADRAAIWLKRLPAEDNAAGQAWQVYAVFDEVETLEADASFALTARRLPVQGVIRTPRDVELHTDLLLDGPPETRGSRPDPRDAALFLDEAEQIFLADARRIAAGDPAPSLSPAMAARRAEDRIRAQRAAGALEAGEDGVRVRTGRIWAGEAERALAESEAGIPRTVPLEQFGNLTAPAAPPPIFGGRGTFFISAGDRAVLSRGEDSNDLQLSGGVVVQYTDRTNGRTIEITGQRGVVFLKPGAITEQLARFDADQVEGVYLEGNVSAGDGTYSVRSPRVYYDVAGERALLLDAVFWTYEPRSGMPLYLRADAVRQEAGNQFSADRAELANTSFSSPPFSIGVRDVTVTVSDPPEDPNALGGRTYVDARNITLEGGGVPFFWWSVYTGDPEQFPLRAIGVTDSSRIGTGITTTWNAFSLFGIRPPEGVAADLNFDYSVDRNFGLGLGANWNRGDHKGGFFSYLFPDDDGEDVMPNGRKIDRENETRGLFLAEQRWRVNDLWTLQAEVAYISDEALVPAIFRELGREAREFTNRAYLKRLEEETLLTIEASMRGTDFISNQNILQSPGYTVDRLPEVRFTQTVNDIFDETAPGVLTHSWEASYSRIRMSFNEVDSNSLGYVTDRQATDALGTLAAQSTGDVLRAWGLNEEWVDRFDTRHELSAQLDVGPLRVTPFVVGRFTNYSSDFAEFSPDEDEHNRVWGAAGVTVSTQLTRVNNNIDSRFFDIHRTRHIIEPSITVWSATTNLAQSDIPVFDDDVESLLEGTVFRAAIDQTWQTKRGGPGRWRDVDVFRFDVEYVTTSSEVDRENPIPRYYEARPELSTPGEFLGIEAAWQVSEVLAIAGETIYDFDIDQVARTSVGILLQHRPGFQTTFEMRHINSQNDTYGDLTSFYELNDKYAVVANISYNFEEGDFQNVGASVLREFPNGTLGLTLNYNNIRSETSFGFVFRPVGGGSGRGIAAPSRGSDVFGG